MKLPITLPFDKFISLTRTMFESNPLISVHTNYGILNSDDTLFTREGQNKKSVSHVTIKSIEVRLPQFSIGDTVMIVDTGEIGSISEIFYHGYGEAYYIHSNVLLYYKDEIVKIPTDLLPLLNGDEM